MLSCLPGQWTLPQLNQRKICGSVSSDSDSDSVSGVFTFAPQSTLCEFSLSFYTNIAAHHQRSGVQSRVKFCILSASSLHWYCVVLAAAPAILFCVTTKQQINNVNRFTLLVLLLSLSGLVFLCFAFTFHSIPFHTRTRKSFTQVTVTLLCDHHHHHQSMRCVLIEPVSGWN